MGELRPGGRPRTRIFVLRRLSPAVRAHCRLIKRDPEHFDLGVDDFVLERAIATDLLPAIEAVKVRREFISLGGHRNLLPGADKPSNL